MGIPTEPPGPLNALYASKILGNYKLNKHLTIFPAYVCVCVCVCVNHQQWLLSEEVICSPAQKRGKKNFPFCCKELREVRQRYPRR
jgi:hypothetical protein